LTIVPLCVGEVTLGVIYMDRPAVQDSDKELLQIFANQAAVAIQNSQLYEMAALDLLTGVYTRRFFEQWILRALHAAFRSQQVLSVLMLDLDGMKHINDTVGHPAGDQVLRTLGKVLREATRSSDAVGRYGGDEFSVILPQTHGNDAKRVAQRILEFLGGKSISGPTGQIPLRVSIGLSVLEPHTFSAADIPRPVSPAYFEAMARILIQQADEALYQAKREGGNRIGQAITVEWQPLSE
jgi:diguanylate cyclase (GGDEF)-like protein